MDNDMLFTFVEESFPTNIALVIFLVVVNATNVLIQNVLCAYFMTVIEIAEFSDFCSSRTK